MNRTQIAQIYDKFPESQQNMPREQFIKEVTDALDPTTNGEILAQMVHQKQQYRQGQIQRAQIDAAIKRSR